MKSIILLTFLAIQSSLATIPLISNLLPSLLPNSKLSWEGGSFCRTSFNQSQVEYIPRNIIGMKFVMYLEKLILLTPKYKRGNPSSLVSYDTRQKLSEPIFDPYPSFECHQEGKCCSIQNAIDLYLDDRNQLWVLDSGILNMWDGPKFVCSPKIVCIDVILGRVVKKIDLSKFVSDSTKLSNIVADTDASTGNTFLYVGDGGSGKILVYDNNKSKMSVVVFPQNVGKTSQQDDRLYLMLAKTPNHKSILYFTFLDSPEIHSIKTEMLRSNRSVRKAKEVGRKQAPLVFLGTNNGDKLYFRYEYDYAVYEWDTNLDFNENNLRIVYQGAVGCSVPTCVYYDKFVRSLKVLESNAHDYMANKCGVGVTHIISKI